MHKTLKWKWIQDYEKDKEQQKKSTDEEGEVRAHARRLQAWM